MVVWLRSCDLKLDQCATLCPCGKLSPPDDRSGPPIQVESSIHLMIYCDPHSHCKPCLWCGEGLGAIHKATNR